VPPSPSASSGTEPNSRSGTCGGVWPILQTTARLWT
jgi:hypothetical protein